MLFQPNFPRTGDRADLRESDFEYLQRSNRPQAIQMCEWMEKWFDGLPSNARRELESKLKYGTPENFYGALFELQCHRILTGLGLAVEYEPPLTGTSEKIDFLAYPPGRKGQCFYVEAAVSGFGKGNLRSDPNEYSAVERIKQGIQKGHNLHSDVYLETEGILPKDLPKKYVRCAVRQFRELLERYHPDEVRRLYFTHEPWNWPQIEPFKPCEKWDWTLKGHLAPVFRSSGVGQIDGPSRGGSFDDSHSLSASLNGKAEKWSKFDFEDRPFLVAVNACDSDFFWGENDTIAIRRALFDKPSHEGQCGEFRRKLRCISGVIVFGSAVLGNEVGAQGNRISSCPCQYLQQVPFIEAAQESFLPDAEGSGAFLS